MVADIARLTYDPTRQYRALVYQQGRVTLEADDNEAARIASEALRLETIDLVGPAGTPDNGYAVTTGANSVGLFIRSGTFYLGGWRLALQDPVDLSEPANGGLGDLREGRFVVALLATEQSVGAVEDQALREVALGGPDSAARLRLMQRFPHIRVDGATCKVGAEAVAALLKTEGVTIDPASYELISSARLKAGFVPGPPKSDPCTPAASGGYLGADNQMLRVTVTAFDPTTNTGTLLWGWNNASQLYRAKTSDGKTLTLANAPVDQEHAPQKNQMVEILLSELDLGDGDYVAAGEGVVTGVAQAYAFDTQQLVVSDALPSNYHNAAAPIFVRLWQASVDFIGGKAIKLDDASGILVTITMNGAIATPPPAGTIAARPFWGFSVRPSAPTAIYPRRYLDKPQPPDGPRQWIADLAVIEAAGERFKVLEDCRPVFQPLTAQSGGCCGVTLGPDDVVARGGLQAVVDSLAGAPAVLSLKPGAYPLAAPLQLTVEHAGLTIEACGGGVTLSAAGSDLAGFRLGLIVFSGATGITLRDLAFDAPLAPVGAKGAKSKAATLCGLLIGDAQGLTIEGCLFTLEAISADTFGGGVVVVGATSAIELRRNRFVGSAAGAAVCGLLAWVDETSASTEFDQWTIRDNRFESLAFGAFVYAQLGLVACRDNVAADCGTGFVFAEANLGVTGSLTYEAMTAADQNRDATLGAAAYASLRPDLLTKMVAGGAPILTAFRPAPAAPSAVSDVARRTLADQLKTSGVAAYKSFVAATAPTGQPATTGATTVDTAAFDKLNAIAVAAELLQRNLTPALRLEDNEVTLSATSTTPWVGIAAILSADEPGSAIVSGNRVVTPDPATVACAVLLPLSAVVTGNLFVQLGTRRDGGDAAPSLVVLTASPLIMVASNVVTLSGEYVRPLRTTTPAPGWEFLNSVF